MAGHSHASNVLRTKSANDLKRVKAFTKVTRDIVNSVRFGGSADPQLNFMLRSALISAKDINLPKDKIEKAIRKGQGISDEKEVYLTKIYEVLDSNQNYLLIEAETDNSARTISNLKVLLYKHHVKLLEPGSAIKLFRKVGEISLEIKKEVESEIINELDRLIILDGIMDYILDGMSVKLITEKDQISQVVKAIGRLDSLRIINTRLIYQNIEARKHTKEELSELEMFKDNLLEMEDIIEVWW